MWASEEENLPCEIVVDSTTYRFGRDSAITLANPSGELTVDSQGRWYSPGREGGRVLQWAPNGTLLRVLGTPGDGPGELARGMVGVFVGPGDTLYIRDDHLHWVLFDTLGRYVRDAEMGPIDGSSSQTTLFLPGGAVVSSINHTLFEILILDRRGRTLRSEVPRPQQEHPAGRPLAAARENGTFWIGPIAGPKAGYRLERWDTTGSIVQVVDRDVAWFKAQPSFSGSEKPGAPIAFPFPSIVSVVQDSLGRLWVLSAYAARPDAEVTYRKIMDELTKKHLTTESMRRAKRELGELISYRMEVLDPTTGSLLAGITIPASEDFTTIHAPMRPMWSRLREEYPGVYSVSLLAFSVVGSGASASRNECPIR